MAAARWQRSGPACKGQWTWNGWVIQHCGHPTALYPYLLFHPDGRVVTLGEVVPPDAPMWAAEQRRRRRMPITPETSAKWARLAAAQQWAELHHQAGPASPAAECERSQPTAGLFSE